MSENDTNSNKRKNRKQKKTTINIKEKPNSVQNDEQYPNTTNQPNENQSETNNKANNEKVNSAPPSQLELNIQDDDEPSGSKVLGIIAIVLGILVIFAGFTAYKYFTQEGENVSNSDQIATVNSDSTNSSDSTENKEESSDKSKQNNFFAFFNNKEDTEGIEPLDTNETPSNEDTSGFEPNRRGTTTADVLGDSDGIEAIDSSNDITAQVIDLYDEDQSSISTVSNSSPISTWTANDYSYGDIQTGEYHVQSGDTLWELSEAAYGDGAQWHKIAEANNVSYLSNGNPLIIAGSTIVIP